MPTDHPGAFQNCIPFMTDSKFYPVFSICSDIVAHYCFFVRYPWLLWFYLLFLGVLSLWSGLKPHILRMFHWPFWLWLAAFYAFHFSWRPSFSIQFSIKQELMLNCTLCGPQRPSFCCVKQNNYALWALIRRTPFFLF